MYDPVQALAMIDQNKVLVLTLLAGAVIFSFVYFIIGVRMAIIQKVYVVPFLGASFFLWHDVSFILHYPVWISEYNGHWWLMVWSVALVGTVALELFLIWQIMRYGHKELMPDVSKKQFNLFVVLATIGTGAMWWFIKLTLNDPIFLVTCIITAVWSVPFHTGIMLRRRSRAGQSIAMEVSVIIIFACMAGILMKASPFFTSPGFIAFLVAFMIWPLVNIWMILQYPDVVPEKVEAGSGAVPVNV